jgi:hypothetical protein
MNARPGLAAQSVGAGKPAFKAGSAAAAAAAPDGSITLLGGGIEGAAR